MNERFLPEPRSDSELARFDRLPAHLLADPAFERDDAGSSVRLHTAWQTLFRWRWLVLATLFVCVAIATLSAALQTPLYRASATLELNPAPTRVVRTGDAGSEEPRQPDRDYLALQLGLVKSRSVAEAVARRLNLGRNEAFLQEPVADGRPERAVGKLMSNMAATGTTSDRILQVSFVHANPAVAAQVANGYAEQAVDTNVERGFSATARSRQYIQQRLEATRQELENSERQLIAYARQANIVNVVGGESTPTSGDSAGGTLLATNLVALNAQLAEAENARIVAQQRAAQSAAAAQTSSASDPLIQSLRQQQAQLESEYQQKLQRFLPDFPEMLALRARIQDTQRQIATAAGRTSSTTAGALRGELVGAQNRERQLRSRINQLQSQLLDLGERGVRYTILKRTVDANRSLYNALLSRLGEESSTATRTSSISIIDAATAPGAPFTPNIPRTMILGLLAGLALGAGAAFGADKWYDTIGTPDSLRDLLRLPLLGVIPKVTSKQDVDALLANPRSALSEAYHSVRASLQFIGGGKPPKSIFVTSSRASEGKTSSIIAMSADFASIGLSVVVIDADLRRPSLAGDGKGGLAALLSGNGTIEEELTQTETPGLCLLAAGSTPPDPTVLLASAGFGELIRRLETVFDVVVIDGPPVMGLADAPLIASIAEATVFVIESGTTRRSVAESALRRLKQSRATVVGGILTKFDVKAQGYGEGYGYDYDYGAINKPKRSLVSHQRAAALENS